MRLRKDGKTFQNFTEGQSTILWELTFISGINLKFVFGAIFKVPIVKTVESRKFEVLTGGFI